MKLKYFAMGALTAATITLLTTNKSGEKRINDWKKRIDTTKEDISDISVAAQKTKENLNKVNNLVQEMLPSFINDLNEDVNKFKFQLNPRLNRLNEQIEELNNHLNNKN